MKVLHVASFAGNIGDNASHYGARSILREVLGRELEFETLEIRKAYQNYLEQDKWAFDHSFIERVNDVDLTVVGGGNFFELWLEDSPTGTTIGLDPESLPLIRRPIVFHAIGCDPYKGVAPGAVAKFERFLRRASSNPNVRISVRNDGSLKNIQQLLGTEAVSLVQRVPDPGFFVEAENISTSWLPGNLIGINVAQDMEGLRFTNPSFGVIEHLKEVARFIHQIALDPRGFNFLLFPHIYSDCDAIGKLMQFIPDPIRRSRVFVAPYVQNQAGAEYILSLFRSCSLMIGSRFHTNVCAMALNVPSVGMVTYKKVADLYEELGERRYTWCNNGEFAQELTRLTMHVLENASIDSEAGGPLVEGLRKQSVAFWRSVVSELKL